MTPQQLRIFRQVCRELKKFPALQRLKSVRRRKIVDLAEVYEDSDGYYHITISINESYDEALDDLAHECAHILVEMDNTHGPNFQTMESAMRRIIRRLADQISQSHELARQTRGR